MKVCMYSSGVPDWCVLCIQMLMNVLLMPHPVMRMLCVATPLGAMSVIVIVDLKEMDSIAQVLRICRSKLFYISLFVRC